MKHSRPIYLLVAVLVCAGPASTATTIDPERQYQTIEGFGGLVSEWNMDIHNNQTLINSAVRDLGVSIMRFLAIVEFEQTNENADAESMDLSRFSVGGGFGTQMSLIQKFQTAASGALKVDKYFVSPLSPPAFMKTNGSTVGGKLTTTMYAEYAEYLAAYCKAVKQQTGVDLYAISMENEPEWEQWYSSCVVTPTEMRDLMRVVRPRFQREALSTKLLWAETLTSSTIWGQYLSLVARDSIAGAGGGVYAVHSYIDGVNPADPGVNTWTLIARAAATFPNVSLWMSETSGYPADWAGAMSMAGAIFGALKYGKVSAWVWHSLNATDPGHIQEALMENGVPRKHYYIAKQFYRWIRPGAVMIDATTTDSTAVVAFRHEVDRTLTVVCLNKSTSAVTTTLQGTGLPSSFDAYRTSATENCVSLGSTGVSVTLPPSSVTTLHATGYNPVVAVRDAAKPVRVRTATPAARLFELDGREFPVGAAFSVGAGIRVHVNEAGAVLVPSGNTSGLRARPDRGRRPERQ